MTILRSKKHLPDHAGYVWDGLMHVVDWSVVYDAKMCILPSTCHLAIVNVCMIIILYIGNTQISILLFCFLYLFVELMIMMNE